MKKTNTEDARSRRFGRAREKCPVSVDRRAFRQIPRRIFHRNDPRERFLKPQTKRFPDRRHRLPVYGRISRTYSCRYAGRTRLTAPR